MNYGSVCSGIEAASLAWKHLGWTAKFYAEVEPFPAAVLCQRFGATRPMRPLDPAEAHDEKDRKLRESWKKQIAGLPPVGRIPNLGDFPKIKDSDYDGHIDLLVGGCPCQSYSVAGLRKGLADPRGNLTLEFVKLAYRTGARIVVFENVPGILSSGDGGSDFAGFLSLLCGWEVKPPRDGWRKCGIVTNAPGCFGVAWRILDAQYTRVPEFPRAVPQRRRRLILVGHLDSWLYPAKVLFDGEMLGGDTPPRRTKRQGFAADSESGVAPSDCKELNGNDCFDIRQVEVQERNLSPTLIATDYKGGKAVSFYTQRKAESMVPLEECSNTLVNGTCPGHQNAVCFQQNTRDEIRLMNGDGAIAGALAAELGSKQQNYLCYEHNPTDARLKEVPVSPTVLGRWGTGGNQTPLVVNDDKTSSASNDRCGKEAQREGGEPSEKSGAEEVSSKNMDVVGFIKNDAGGNLQGFWNEVFPTMRTEITPAVARRECFNLTFCDANGTRKDRPDGGLYVTPADASKTVTTGGTNAETVVVALDGDKLAKAERKGGSGLGVSEDGVMYTQTVKDVHAVAYDECVPLDLRNATRDPEKCDAVNRQGVGVGTDGDPMGTISAGNVPGVGWRATVRRLLPVECERLMGFPDNHTRIVWKGLPEEECPDAPRYKACGNSMCVNVMAWVGKRIDCVEKNIATNMAIIQTQPGESQ
ncbi:MAG: DNA cytosine methyltransferase [Victivallaceae bacterium]|nr:DNA cytosine methyltransferase [Victivallaceae bacterium]